MFENKCAHIRFYEKNKCTFERDFQKTTMDKTPKTSIAIIFNGKDCLRIIPFGSDKNKAEIKFSFFDSSFIVRKFSVNKDVGGSIFNYSDWGIASNELTYHNSNKYHTKPSILPKYKNKNIKRTPIFNEIIDLDLRNLLVPIPICRITVNKETDKQYKQKNHHNVIELTDKYNTVEIYISSVNYDFDILAKRFPTIVQQLSPIITIDYLLYGAGEATIPIMNKMFENKTPITAIESNQIGQYRIHYKTYELIKSNAFLLYSQKEYAQNNFIEFFNNIDYLDLLATTHVGFKINGTDKYNTKPAYIWDIAHLKNIGFHNNYIKRWNNRFHNKEMKLKRMKKNRSGIITG